MARIVEVQKNDSMIKLLESEKGIKGAEVYQWLKKAAELNPHIGNLDLIHPKERILIPDTLQERVSQKVIWENALSHVPENIKTRPPLALPDEHMAYTTKAGDGINRIAEMMFADGPNHAMPLNAKRAILLHNNPKLFNYLNGSVPIGTLVNLTTFKLTDYERYQWENAQSRVKSELDALDNNLKQTFGDMDLEVLSLIANNAQVISSADRLGAGLDDTVQLKTRTSDENTRIKDEIIVTGGNIAQYSSYGLGAGSAFAGSGSLALAQSNALLQVIYQDAFETFGEAVLRKPQNHMSKIERFLKAHPKWNELMKQVKKMPNLLLPKEKLRPRFNAGARFPNANIFKNHIVKVHLNPNAQRYTRSLAKSLNGKISIFKGWAGRFTWGLPMILGGISVAMAPPEQRVRTLFEEGFGVVGGAFGTWIGSAAVFIAGYSVLPLIGICISPAGIFIAAFLIGGYLGYKLSTVGKEWGGSIHDRLMPEGGSRFYHSMEQYIESFY
jgi:hypothetical protein